ncbi:MAG: hypothetical protein EPN97_04830 [Alphaproteobacteria bacterium]|nr:MAG: hypothetical protein EPN97_04830 [Alphaproteobacteria bacterium]
MASNITTINRDIADGESFSHKGSVELNGNIGKGAVIDIKDGGIHVKGAVADNASITAKGGSGMSGISVSGGSVVIRGSISGVTIVNGRVISGGGATQDSGLSGIIIEKTTGSGVTLETDGAIELKANAGDSLRAKADGSITLSDTGAKLKANSGGSLEAGNIGPNSKVSSGGSLHIEELGHQSGANAGGSVHIEKIGNDCNVNAGGSAHVERIGRDSSLNAGGSAKVSVAHTEATISAGGSKKVSRTSAKDGDFELSTSFQAVASQAAAEGISTMKPIVLKKPDEPAADGDDKPGKPKLRFNL